jgi:hypothetical protein
MAFFDSLEPFDSPWSPTKDRRNPYLHLGSFSFAEFGEEFGTITHFIPRPLQIS